MVGNMPWSSQRRPNAKEWTRSSLNFCSWWSSFLNGQVSISDRSGDSIQLLCSAPRESSRANSRAPSLSSRFWGENPNRELCWVGWRFALILAVACHGQRNARTWYPETRSNKHCAAGLRRGGAHANPLLAHCVETSFMKARTREGTSVSCVL